MDRSFDASGFIASNLLGPRAQEVLQDYDPMESIRWAEWASLRAATIMKSIKPRLMAADQWEGKLEALEKEKVQEAERRKDREAELEGEIQDLPKSVSEEKARADKAEASLAESERGCDE
ncbi:hypothetical protein PIB30_073619 [Stylosanthes scabra]|uniref:Uncharacterized protein n=1 Tax=Stylosanthes scabra TaxID=79078 RepID=A0ABU6TP26_9FABA|nr:hypothetical protein [Stylosanthes scabra]